MALKNKRLKKYINANTTSVIRARANECKVTKLNFDDNCNDFEAHVNGSSGIPYVVNFSGLENNPIQSNCSCPFDHGPVCKHEVAVAIEAEAYFLDDAQSSSEFEALDKKNAVKVDESYMLIMEKDLSINDLIRLNSHPATYRSLRFHPDQIRIIHKDETLIRFQLASDYWSSSHKEVTIQKKGEELRVHCSCSKKKNKLCNHQGICLLYMEKEMPAFFQSKTEINNLKETLLNQFGFTLKDETYLDYFLFDYINGELTIIPKQKGTLRLSKFKDFEIFGDNLFNKKNIIESHLPFLEKKKKTKKETGIGLVFYFSRFDFRGNELSAIPVSANLNKERTDIFNKIEEIDSTIFLREKVNYSEKEVAIIEKALLINTDYSVLAKKNYDLEKIRFQHLKELLDLISPESLVYTLLEDYYSDKIMRRDLTPITFHKKAPKLSFKIKEETHFFVLKAYLKIDGDKKEKAIVKNKTIWNFFFVEKNNNYYLHQSLHHAKTVAFFGINPELRIHKDDFESYYADFIQPLSEQFEVSITHKKKRKKEISKKDLKKQVYLSEHDDIIVFKPIVEYNQKQYVPLSNSFIEESNGEFLYKIERLVEFETAFVESIQKLHSNFEDQSDDFFYIEKEAFLENNWFLDVFEQLKAQDIEIFGFDTLSKMKYNMHKPSINTSVTSGVDWFDVHIEIKFGDQMVSLKDVRKSIVKKENYIALNDGTIGILPQEWVEKYSHAFRAGEVKKDSINVSKYQLSVIDSLYEDLDNTSELAISHKQIKEQLANFSKIEKVKTPKGVNATLRDYQKEGLNWLNFLDHYSFGGCLADDMGLGKTLQIITFLKHIKNTQKPNIASLIIVPTSLIFNWQEELKKFSPELTFSVHTGSEREKTADNFNKVDIIITTYGIVMRDISFQKEHFFNYIILDESQAIKNPTSKRFKAVRLLKSTNKLVLTGTPIENNTFDLYAQMTFVNPGLLGSMANFKKQYSTPIDKNKDADVANDLRKLINPFLLRRTKEQVATELPEKTEQVLYCTMEKEQQQTYEAYKNKYRNYLLNKIDENGIGKSKMYVLEGLTKLRQICDAPSLLNDDETYTNESIKIKELIKHITEKTGEHKILVFSQFVKMLSLISAELNTNDIQFEYLDGKTKDRQKKVDNFQNNNEVRVFLISLKAGGTGLNLTSADYVYIVDPWWNPAVEAQAIDRCYRIGQTKNVMAYKMICKGTIEEKIMTYQSTKKQLSTDIIQTDESFVKNLTKESITELFS